MLSGDYTIGSHTAYIVRQRIWKQHKNMRQWNLDPSRRAGLELFLNRPTTNRGWKGKNYDVSREVRGSAARLDVSVVITQM